MVASVAKSRNFVFHASIILLAGCASGPVVPEVVRVPVPVPCIEATPAKPVFLSDSDLLALDDFGLVVSLARERRLYQGYTAEIEAVIAGCR